MKRYPGIALILAIASLSLVEQTAAQAGTWVRLEDGPRRFNGRFDDVFFITPKLGWIVSTAGDVYKTTDGGETWTHPIDGDIGRGLRSVGFVTNMRGYIGSLVFGKVLWETLDGGETWTDITDRISGPIPEGICGISVVDADHIFGVGRFSGPATFVKTTDGGQTWQSKSLSPDAETLIDVHFFNALEGLAVGGISNNLNSGNRAVVLQTTDGGDTWTRRHVTNGPESEWGWKITFPSRFTGYVSVEYISSSGTPASILKTTNGGGKWQEYNIPMSTESSGLQGIGFVTNELGWAGGRGTTTQSSSGGEAWQTFGTIDGRVNRFRFLGDTLGYAVGEYVYKYTTATSNGVDGHDAQDALQVEAVYPQPSEGQVTIRFRQGREDDSYGEIFDARGRRVADLGVVGRGSGIHEFLWDGQSDGRRLAAGIYYLRIRVGDASVETPMVIAAGR